MSEEKKTIELKDEELEKVNGGVGTINYKIVTVEQGYYKIAESLYLYLFKTIKGPDIIQVPVKLYFARDGLYESENLSNRTLGYILNLQKVEKLPWNLPWK